MSLSVVISAHNNQDLIEDCLKSVQHLADEVILVDNESVDQTVKIAKKYHAQIFTHLNNPATLNESKNFGFTKATGDWILSLDTDERVPPELAHEIKTVTNHKSLTTNHSAYQFPRKNIIFGKWIEHGLWYPDHQIRLFKKGLGKFGLKHNHEKLKVDGAVGSLTGHLIHFNYTSVTQYVDKINHVYSDNETSNFIKTGKKVFWYDAIRMPFADFLTNFFAREGYKDGLHGLVLSLLQAFYTFVVFAKIWEKQNFVSYNSPQFLKEVHHEFTLKSQEYRYWLKHKNPSFFRNFIGFIRKS